MRASLGGIVKDILNGKFAVLLAVVAGISFVLGYAFVMAVMS